MLCWTLTRFPLQIAAGGGPLQLVKVQKKPSLMILTMAVATQRHPLPGPSEGFPQTTLHLLWMCGSGMLGAAAVTSQLLRIRG